MVSIFPTRSRAMQTIATIIFWRIVTNICQVCNAKFINNRDCFFGKSRQIFATILWRIFSPVSLSCHERRLYRNICEPLATRSQTFLCTVPYICTYVVQDERDIVLLLRITTGLLCIDYLSSPPLVFLFTSICMCIVLSLYHKKSFKIKNLNFFKSYVHFCVFSKEMRNRTLK